MRDGKKSVRIIDGVGTLILACGIISLAWVTLGRSDDGRAEIRGLRRRIENTQRELHILRSAREVQAALLAERAAELERTGQLPAEPPIDSYFQTLSSLAARHGLRVLHQNPLAPRTYPGLAEYRYAFEVTGPAPAVVRFLKSIEDADYWADVSYLQVERGSAAEDQSTDDRVALLTISLFSAPDEVAHKPGREGT